MARLPEQWQSRDSFVASLPKALVCAQLGVWRGLFSSKMLNLLQPSELVLVDFWEHYGLPDYQRTRPRQSPAEWDAIYRSVCKKFRPEMDAGKIAIHRASFEQAASLYADGYFDLIYHDGDSAAQHILDTLEQWWPKLKAGGTWVGNGFVMLEHRWPVDGVIGFLRRHPNVVFLGVTREHPAHFVLRKTV